MPFGDFLGAMIGAISADQIANKNNNIQLITNSSNERNVDKTNQMNYQIAKDANEWNKMMQDEMNAWNLAQWNRENFYNSPAQQVSRLKQAGINPAAVFGSGAISQASSLTSAPAQPANVPTMQAHHNEAYLPDPNYLSNAFVGAFNAFSEDRLRQAQIDKLGNDVHLGNAQNAREAEIQGFRLEQLRNLATKEGVLGDIAKEQLKYEQLSQKYRLSLLMGDITNQAEQRRTLMEQRDGYRLQNRLAEVQLAYAPRLNEAELNQYYASVQQTKASIALINANKLLTEQERLKRVEDTISQQINNGLAAQLFKQNEKLRDAYIESAKYNAIRSKWDAIDAFMHSGRGYGSTDRPIWQSFMDSADQFEDYTRLFGKNRIVGR